MDATVHNAELKQSAIELEENVLCRIRSTQKAAVNCSILSIRENTEQEKLRSSIAHE